MVAGVRHGGAQKIFFFCLGLNECFRVHLSTLEQDVEFPVWIDIPALAVTDFAC